MITDFDIQIKCRCGGNLYQTGRYNKMYNHRSFKCIDCQSTTTLTMKGIKRKITLIGKGHEKGGRDE